jgi:hypothetical protein
MLEILIMYYLEYRLPGTNQVRSQVLNLIVSAIHLHNTTRVLGEKISEERKVRLAFAKAEQDLIKVTLVRVIASDKDILKGFLISYNLPIYEAGVLPSDILEVPAEHTLKTFRERQFLSPIKNTKNIKIAARKAQLRGTSVEAELERLIQNAAGAMRDITHLKVMVKSPARRRATSIHIVQSDNVERSHTNSYGLKAPVPIF